MKLNILIMLPIIIYSQNVDMYLSLIHEGQSEGVKEILPELISKYPNDPGVVYLQAMLTTNGMKSLELYSKIIEKFPKSDFAGPASVKIGEYFYAQGLYSQAGMQLRLIPRKYPRIENMQSIIDMVISSFLAIGEGDSVKYYIGIYRGMFPNLDFEKFGIDSPSIPSKKLISSIKSKEPRPYVIQIGAFGSIQNANRLKLQVTQIGYEVEITPLQTLTFYNAVANDGVMVKPQFVKQIRYGNELRQSFDCEVINPKICSESTLSDVKKMLKGVVERGTAKNIKARGFEIAGKTGTSKIYNNKSKKGYESKYQASFCGYFPAKDPLYSCIVVVQGPTKNIFGSVVSGTVFKEIADKVYAHEFNKTDLDVRVPKHYPYSRPGSKQDFITVANAMDIPLEDQSSTSTQWINTRTAELGIKLSEVKSVKGLIPNVVGMGLIDAAYLLEKNGLVVQIEGSGIVRKQSVRPGLKIKKGQTVKLSLG